MRLQGKGPRGRKRKRGAREGPEDKKKGLRVLPKTGLGPLTALIILAPSRYRVRGRRWRSSAVLLTGSRCLGSRRPLLRHGERALGPSAHLSKHLFINTVTGTLATRARGQSRHLPRSSFHSTTFAGTRDRGEGPGPRGPSRRHRP
jgi:hypothetical protein